MGVFEERSPLTSGMHWQQHQHDQYIGPAYDPSRDLSPNLPSCDAASSMSDVPTEAPPSSLTPSTASSSSNSSSTSSGGNSGCSTPINNNNNNHQHCHNQPSQCGGAKSSQQQQTSCNHHQQPSSCNHRSFQGLHGHQSDDFKHHFHLEEEHHIPKLEPPGTPPPVEKNEIAICAGCGQRISDRFYLQAVDRRWHATCLQCCQCRHTLDGEITCFSRDGNIYCKKDYYRLFGMKRCARCQAAILASELVMRARDLVFHVQCFTCGMCNAPFAKGDHFGMRDGAVLCRLHYELATDASSTPTSGGGGGPGGPYPPHYGTPYPSPDFHQHHVGPPQQPPGPSLQLNTIDTKVPYFNGAPAVTAPRQKGRPRKRKPKDLESMTANLDYLDMSFGRSPGTPGMPGSNQRTKRMRTSFKHHQLRAMKTYFALNHNPDAKDLKQLSQKTGLPKRVLQVWFQNARAKWRRMMLKQEGKPGDKCGDLSSGDLDLYGPGSMAGSIQSLPPHSPPFMLGGGPSSPSSLDCA